MEQIQLQQILPDVFANRTSIDSDIWQQTISLHKGKIYLIEAASGCGKSSICSYLYGFRNDYQGRIAFDETDIRSLSVQQWTHIRKFSISILFQELRLFSELTAWENVQLKNNLTNFKKTHEIEILFEKLGIETKRNTPVCFLSYGQQQRVAFIRALCQPFDFLLLDEPASHLDLLNEQIMSHILQEEYNNRGNGIILTSIGKKIDLPYDKVFHL